MLILITIFLHFVYRTYCHNLRKLIGCSGWLHMKSNSKPCKSHGLRSRSCLCYRWLGMSFTHNFITYAVCSKSWSYIYAMFTIMNLGGAFNLFKYNLSICGPRTNNLLSTKKVALHLVTREMAWVILLTTNTIFWLHHPTGICSSCRKSCPMEI